jgi:hypothetical protein
VKRKERLSRLKFEVRQRLLRHFSSLGFERIKSKEVRARWLARNPWDLSFGRTHDGRLDFVEVYWDERREAKFRILFATCEEGSLERMKETLLFADLHSGHHALPGGLLGLGGDWFGDRQSAEDAVDLAIQRVDELDAFLMGPRQSASARIVRFGFNDYAPTISGRWLSLALIRFPRWLGRSWRSSWFRHTR